MSKKKTTASKIISAYMEWQLENETASKSIYQFCKKNGFEESDFYSYFANFKGVEKAIFKAFFDNTHDLLKKSDDFKNHPPREQLLSFYYTFFETLTANRSYVMLALQDEKNKLRTLKVLKDLRISFKNFVNDLNIEKLDLKNEKAVKFQEKAMAEIAWLQLLGTLKFWLEDDSTAFEKTDILIEKSVNTSFDIIDTKIAKSVLDLGKFLFKESAFTR